MKNIISPFTFVIFIVFSFLFLYSCSDSSNPTKSNDSSLNGNASLEKRPIKDDNPPVLNYFQIVNGDNTVDLTSGNDPINAEIIDITTLSNKETRIQYSASHPDGITVNAKIWYYSNGNGDWNPLDVSNISYIVENSNTETYSELWEGKVTGGRYDQDNFTNNNLIMDQKLGYNGLDADADLYRVEITIESPTSSITKNTFIWLKADPAIGEMWVEDIQLDLETIKKKTTPRATIILNTNSNVRLYYNWGGNIIGDGYIRPIHGNGNSITIEGPTFRSNASGDIKFSVLRVYLVDHVYNPSENNPNLGTSLLWNEMMPTTSLTLP